MRQHWTLIVCLLGAASGCTEDRSQVTLTEPASAAREAESPETPQAYAGPADARAVLADGDPGSEQLAAWALDEQAPTQVRVTSLRRLEAAADGDALDAALSVLADPNADPQLRANAVAVLARSKNPRADAHIASLEPRAQRLVKALREAN